MAKWFLVGILLLLAGCGGGGGGAAQNNSPTTAKAVFKAANPSGSGQTVAALEATINFPYGVTPTQPVTSAIKFLNFSTGTAVNSASYTPATSSSDGKFTFGAATVGFTKPEQQIEISFSITPGFFPKAGQFSISDYRFWDTNGALVNITPTLDTQIQ